jgi:hypothetical protein
MIPPSWESKFKPFHLTLLERPLERQHCAKMALNCDMAQSLCAIMSQNMKLIKTLKTLYVGVWQRLTIYYWWLARNLLLIDVH